MVCSKVGGTLVDMVNKINNCIFKSNQNYPNKHWFMKIEIELKLYDYNICTVLISLGQNF